MVDACANNSQTLRKRMPTFFLIVRGKLQSCGIASMSYNWIFKLFPIVDYGTIM